MAPAYIKRGFFTGERENKENQSEITKSPRVSQAKKALFQCDNCPKMFSSKTHLSEHENWHKESQMKKQKKEEIPEARNDRKEDLRMSKSGTNRSISSAKCRNSPLKTRNFRQQGKKAEKLQLLKNISKDGKSTSIEQKIPKKSEEEEEEEIIGQEIPLLSSQDVVVHPPTASFEALTAKKAEPPTLPPGYMRCSRCWNIFKDPKVFAEHLKEHVAAKAEEKEKFVEEEAKNKNKLAFGKKKFKNHPKTQDFGSFIKKESQRLTPSWIKKDNDEKNGGDAANVDHGQKERQTTTLICVVCANIFSNAGEFTAHMMRHSPQLVWPQQQQQQQLKDSYNQEYDTFQTFQTHREKVRRGVNVLVKCLKCPQYFTREETLNCHIEDCHNQMEKH
jgi:uncharacterized C2H2 Zn-finger protein